jgi:hypothetical protein
MLSLTPACVSRMTCASGLAGKISGGNARAVLTVSDVVAGAGTGGGMVCGMVCACASFVCEKWMATKPTTTRVGGVINQKNLLEKPGFIIRPVLVLAAI